VPRKVSDENPQYANTIYSFLFMKKEKKKNLNLQNTSNWVILQNPENDPKNIIFSSTE
jgi:hypothetical protein